MASNGGGAIVNDDSSSLSIINSEFTKNIAVGNGAGKYGNGGAIFTLNALLTVYNSTFTGNSANYAVRGGGAIDALEYKNCARHSIVNVNRSIFLNNTSKEGGAIHNIYGTFTLANSTVTGNKATGNGGAIYNGYGKFTITNTTIKGSSAYDGGAVHNAFGTLTVTSSKITDNRASHDGGAIYNIHGASKIQYNNITGNSASHYGGAIFNSGSNITVHYNNIVDNDGINEVYSPNNNYASVKSYVYAQDNWWGKDEDPSGRISIAGNSVYISGWKHSPQI